jgi:hypothetical protein
LSDSSLSSHTPVERSIFWLMSSIFQSIFPIPQRNESCYHISHKRVRMIWWLSQKLMGIDRWRIERILAVRSNENLVVKEIQCQKMRSLREDWIGPRDPGDVMPV